MKKGLKKEFNYIVYTDGACSNNPGPGGWAVLIYEIASKKVCELAGHAAQTTNNKMEMTAVGKALRALENKKGPILICTDSNYVVQGLTDWLKNWKKNNWKTSQGKAVANENYWKRLEELIDKRIAKYQDDGRVEFLHVAAHKGIAGNERVDEIAVAYSHKKNRELYQGALNEYCCTEEALLSVLAER